MTRLAPRPPTRTITVWEANKIAKQIIELMPMRKNPSYTRGRSALLAIAVWIGRHPDATTEEVGWEFYPAAYKGLGRKFRTMINDAYIKLIKLEELGIVKSRLDPRYVPPVRRDGQVTMGKTVAKHTARWRLSSEYQGGAE